ncbi:YihY/virulence factor BrkB family protein [Parvularcula lutaonensis]|uniref:YihY/virulence factor BrkB family protein n=1 Tax=Parvularcula lutaonensis TaxID=491923 RepID=A0ABV7MFJ6_9PROT|nr:YihY/virulence factor BrkB family protein [Parvularcula lutaonensis]GGY54927.1 hypothetical protein GCM10007148_25850 [Parvularcula lutaonensis]
MSEHCDPEGIELGKGRGRKAAVPWAIPPKGWIDIALRFWRGFNSDNLTLVAAGVAYYTLLALFPGIVLFVSIYGLVTDPINAAEDARAISSVLPPLAAEFVYEEMRRVASAGTGGLSLVSLVSLLVALFGAGRAIKSMFQALNVAYGESEDRNLLKINALGFVFTLGFIVAGAIVLALVVALPAALKALHLPLKTETLISFARWPVLFFGMVAATSLLYRIGPSRRDPQFRWVSVGAVASSILWLLVSWGISFYASNITDFSGTYGAFGAIILLQTWLWATALVILIGAKINAEIEHQTACDSTIGPDRPIGERGAWVADELGRRFGPAASDKAPESARLLDDGAPPTT